jgi:alanyl-tRNA synthetase
MTDLLYYNQPYLTEFECEVMEARVENDFLNIILNGTIFYPGGGGQLPDHGLIDKWPLLKIKKLQNTIVHSVEKTAPLKKGGKVKIKLDWPRRFYHMQQHSGQHLLSRLLYEQNLQTVSVHLGEQQTLIEIKGQFNEEIIKQKIIPSARKYIAKALPIKSYELKRNDLKKIPLRREAGDWDTLRIVEIDGYEYAACGGTHLNNSAQIGTILYAGYEKIRSNIRLKFLIGQSAEQQIEKLQNLEKGVGGILSCGVDNALAAIMALKNENHQQRQENKRYRKTYIQQRAAEIISTKTAVVFAVLKNEPIKDLQDIARYIASNYESSALLLGEDKFVLTAPEKIKNRANAFMNECRRNLSIKGGGPPGFIQGIYRKDEKEALKTAFINFFKDLDHN